MLPARSGQAIGKIRRVDQAMDKLEIIPGRRVEIGRLGEGTIVENHDDEVEIALSEIETVRVRPDELSDQGGEK